MRDGCLCLRLVLFEAMLDFEALKNAPVEATPYRHFIASEVMGAAQAASVRADFPAISKPGYLPLSKLQSQGAFAELIAALQSEDLASVLSDQLDIDLMDKPRMITVRRLSQLSDGPPHTDSQSKLVTMLTYLNETWDGTSDGCIRVLNSENLSDYVTEVPPLAGTVFAFRREAASWHGHLPFAGERYVVQTTFLTSQAELDRKENRGGLQLLLKKLNPFQ